MNTPPYTDRYVRTAVVRTLFSRKNKSAARAINNYSCEWYDVINSCPEGIHAGYDDTYTHIVQLQEKIKRKQRRKQNKTKRFRRPNVNVPIHHRDPLRASCITTSCIARVAEGLSPEQKKKKLNNTQKYCFWFLACTFSLDYFHHRLKMNTCE